MALKRRMRKQGGRATKRRRTMAISRPVRWKNTTLSCKKMCYQGSWAFSTASTNGFWRYLTWTANNGTQNFPEIQALFDEYKINAIKVTFRPRYDTVNVTDVVTSSAPHAYAHYVIDPASTTSPNGVYGAANLNAFLEQQGVRTRTLNRPFSIYFKPKMADGLSGGTTAARAIRPTFVKTTNAGVEFTGVHMYIQQNNMSNTNPSIILDQFVTLYMQVKNLK